MPMSSTSVPATLRKVPVSGGSSLEPGDQRRG